MQKKLEAKTENILHIVIKILSSKYDANNMSKKENKVGRKGLKRRKCKKLPI